MIEGSLEVKLPTIKTDEKQRWEESEKRREGERRSKRESLRRKKIQVPEKVGKLRNTVFFPMICGSGGSKSRLAKTAGAEPAGQMRDEKLHAVAARSTFSKSKCTKHLSSGALSKVEMFKKCAPLWCEAHFEVKSVKKLMASEHFWAFRCRSACQAQGIVRPVKSEQNVRVL